MRAGQLNKRVILQARSVSRGDSGGEVVTWTDVDTVWAAIWPKAGREYFSSDQVQAEVSGRIRIRWRADVRPDWRIEYGNRHFDIKAIINVEERDRMLDLMVSEAVT